MILTKTKVGGIFSLIFILLALFIIISSILIFELENEKESKSLIPLVILESEVNGFPSKIFIEVTLDNYGGDCIDSNSNCISEITLTTNQIFVDKKSIACQKQADNCIIQFTCQNCEINDGANAEIQMLERMSYASGISVAVTTDSSVPYYSSTIFQSTTPPSNTIFRGSVPTIFYFTATPSLFKSQITNTQNTGYHISSETQAELGSYYFITDLGFTSGLNVKISLDKSASSLYTVRYDNVTVIILINGLLGSVFGIMGAIGALMRFTERTLLKMISKVKHQNKKDNIILDHKTYKIQCQEETKDKESANASP